MVNIHYALQTCDISNNQNISRYCAETKTEVTEKCVTSFLNSVYYVASKNSETIHNVCIFDDHSSEYIINFLNRAIKHFQKDNLKIELVCLEKKGIMSSIRSCWEWMEKNGKDLVYQVQDDFLFEPHAIFEMIDIWMQLYNYNHTESIVIPYNDPMHWRAGSYFYKPTPRTIVPGRSRYWLQCYDIPCTFMTSKNQFSKHWDLYEKFLDMNPSGENGNLENVTINKIFVDRGVLGLQPFESIALHMQSEHEKDLYIDWQKRWNSVEKI